MSAAIAPILIFNLSHSPSLPCSIWIFNLFQSVFPCHPPSPSQFLSLCHSPSVSLHLSHLFCLSAATLALSLCDWTKWEVSWISFCCPARLTTYIHTCTHWTPCVCHYIASYRSLFLKHADIWHAWFKVWWPSITTQLHICVYTSMIVHVCTPTYCSYSFSLDCGPYEFPLPRVDKEMAHFLIGEGIACDTRLLAGNMSIICHTADRQIDNGKWK